MGYRFRNICYMCNILDLKNPYEYEVIPLLKNLHIYNQHCNYKCLCNQVIFNGFFWINYTTDIRNFLSKCEICNGNKIQKKIYAPINIILDEGPKFRYIVDIWTFEHLVGDTNYLYILDCIDHFSKFMNAFLLINKTMDLVISKIEYFIMNNGVCKILQNDNGKEFDNSRIRIFCENNNIKYIRSTPYHPQSNGSVEILHKIECEYLNKQKNLLKDNFNLEIALAEFAIYHNRKKHSTTQYAPIDIRDSHNEDLIKEVLNNIIKSMSVKIKKHDNNITKGCFLLISTKIIKKGEVYKFKVTKGNINYRIPAIFIKFTNSTTALVKSNINFKDYFKVNDEIKCDIKILNWVDKFVFNYYLEKIDNNSFIDLDDLFEN